MAYTFTTEQYLGLCRERGYPEDGKCPKCGRQVTMLAFGPQFQSLCCEQCVCGHQCKPPVKEKVDDQEMG